MSAIRIAHVLRAPVVGGSELETLAITKALPQFDHQVLYLERYSGCTPSIEARFTVPVTPVTNLLSALDRLSVDVVHIQFPFLLVDEPVGHDSVLELTRLPQQATVFTVHAAVNVPIVPDVHYVFHTESLSRRFDAHIPDARRTVCPSLVAMPEVSCSPNAGQGVRILWVSRNEEAKFHPEVGAIVAAVLAADPTVSFHFVGVCEHVTLPDDPRVTFIPCPAPDIAEEYQRADVFWHFPHPLLEETWCRGVTEAMAYGLPCIVAAHGAMSEQVRDGVSGRVVDDVPRCVQALLQLVASSELERGAMGRAARIAAAGFAAECMKTWPALYTQLAGR